MQRYGKIVKACIYIVAADLFRVTLDKLQAPRWQWRSHICHDSVCGNGNLLLNLFTLMASSGIPGVTYDAVRYVQRALLPDLSDSEAAATFARMIEESLSSWFTQWNFFFHNLAQMRFSGTNDEILDESETGQAGELLSYVPKRHT